MSNDTAAAGDQIAGNQGGDAMTGNEPPTANDGTAGADGASGDASATDSTAVGDTDLGLGGNEELRTGAASDEAFDPASDAGADVTSAEQSSLETPDAENPEAPADESRAETSADTPDKKVSRGAPSADWLPESSPPGESGPVP